MSRDNLRKLKLTTLLRSLNSTSSIMDTNNINNNQNSISQCDHVQLGGQAYYDEKKFFMFTPDDPIVGQVQKFRGLGMGQQMADGTFDFVRKPQLKPKSTLIKKLAHGRASKTKDDAIQLTLKVYRTEGINISEAIRMEAIVAADAIREYQLRH